MSLLYRAWRALGAEGLNGVVRRVKARLGQPAPKVSYAQWWSKVHLIRLGEANGLTPISPTFLSVVMPVFNPQLNWLEEAIQSLQQQTHPNWELCLVDDASTNPAVLKAIESWQTTEPRIKLHKRTDNGHIAIASNDGLRMASHPWVVFMDQDDLLEPHALQRLAQAIDADANLGLLYTDEDQVCAAGRPIKPFFKPDWSPHLALSQAYLGHLVCVNRTLCPIEFDPQLSGSQDHDFWLRCAQGLKARQIRHIPEVLYHWRTHANSTAADASVKPYAKTAGLQAVQNAVVQRYPGLGVRAVEGAYPLTYELDFQVRPGSKVSIIIPTKDKADLLEACVNSIYRHTQGIDFEILVLDNRSVEASTFALFERLQQEHANLRLIKADFDFNWSKLNNVAAQAATGTSFVFLNNDTEVITSNWLVQLNGYAELPDVGVVGALLLFPDGTIQHSGVVVGMGGWADHVFHAQAPDHFNGANPYVSPVLTRNALAVTGACMAVTRAKFEALGGFDERFIICGSDVELCLKAHRQGLYNVMCAQARLVHHESKTRGREVPAVDFEMSALAYEPYRTQSVDPFFNPNLSLSERKPSLKPF